MLQTLASRGRLDTLCCEVSGTTFADDVRLANLGTDLRFIPDEARLFVRAGSVEYMCDGAQRVDVLCSGDKRAIAFEAKLGLDRLRAKEFRDRFMTRCELSHGENRIKGKMVAVLERSFALDSGVELIGAIAHARWEIAKPWWLVVRRETLAGWRDRARPPLASARYIAFESIAAAYGSASEFDRLVAEVVGTDFAARWGIKCGSDAKIPLTD